MLQRFKINKKTAAATTAVLLAAAIMGTTFAWWTARTTAVTEITMGEMKIEASFVSDPARIYEPGETAISSGVIKNTGSVPAVLHIQDTTQISFAYADDDFTPWEGELWKDDTEGAVNSTFDGNDPIGFGEDIEWAWFYDKNNPSDRYLLLLPGVSLDVSIASECIGSVMTNKYMNAKIRISNDIQATQTYDGAMMALFGVDFQGLGMVVDLGDGVGFRAASAVPDSIQQRLLEIFHQI